MTLFLAHVSPAGFQHYGLDKTGGLFECFVLAWFVRVCVCVVSHGPGLRKHHVLIQRKEHFLRKRCHPLVRCHRPPRGVIRWGGEPSLVILLYLTLVHRRLLCVGLNGECIDDLKLSDSVYNKQGGPGETIACQICCVFQPVTEAQSNPI